MEFIKNILRKFYSSISRYGTSCGGCGFNDSGKCTRSYAEYMDCFHSITRPGWIRRPEILTSDLTPEELDRLQKIVNTLQEAEDTARDGGLLGEDWEDKPTSGLIEED